MDLSEIFFSIQGESTYNGLPCIFIRTSGCNLKCDYCDTLYAEKISKILNPDEILKRIKAISNCKLAEITGGEPLIQEEIYELFELLNINKYKVLLETNGSILLDKVPDYVCKIVDVKTPSSGYEHSFIINNLQYINAEKDNLKFVIGDLTDYEWVRNFLVLNNLKGQHILISTVFSKVEPSVIVEKILKDNLDVRFQLQLHKYIWSHEKRGV